MCHNTNANVIFNVAILYIMTTFRKSRYKYNSSTKKDKSGAKNKKHRTTYKIKTSRFKINKYRNNKNSKNNRNNKSVPRRNKSMSRGLKSRKNKGNIHSTKKRKFKIIQKGGEPKKDEEKPEEEKEEEKSEEEKEKEKEEEKPPGFMKRRSINYCIATKKGRKKNSCPNKHTGTITSTLNSMWEGTKKMFVTIAMMMNPYAAMAAKGAEVAMELQRTQAEARKSETKLNNATADAKESETTLNNANAEATRASITSSIQNLGMGVVGNTPQGKALEKVSTMARSKTT